MIQTINISRILNPDIISTLISLIKKGCELTLPLFPEGLKKLISNCSEDLKETIINTIYEIVQYIANNKVIQLDFIIGIIKKSPKIFSYYQFLCNSQFSQYSTINEFKKNSDYPYAICSNLSYSLINNPDEQELLNIFPFQNEQVHFTVCSKQKVRKEYDLSDSNNFLDFRKNTQEFIIAFKGTDPSIRSDLNADTYIACGEFEKSNRYKTCLGFVKWFIECPVFKHTRITLTGHSLGGKIALYVGHNLGLPCVVFNPGSSPIEEQLPYDPRKVRIHKFVDDPISSCEGIKGSTYFYNSTLTNMEAHSLSNFI
jgi:hypothetical protein